MREKLNMNYGWKFHLGEIPFDVLNGHFATYMHSKAQSGQKAAIELYYDGDFKDVNLPHDYVIQQCPKKENNPSQGGYTRENAWYRRHFTLDEEDKGKRIVLLFDGAGQKSTVWVNGHEAGLNESMYNSFYVDITPYLYYGNTKNVVAVHIENTKIEGWWYEGAGLYRNVWMIKTSDVAVDIWGLRAQPEKKDNNIWEVRVCSTIYSTQREKFIKADYVICDENELEIARTSKSHTVFFGQNEFILNLEIKNPHLWDLDNPNLYTVKCIIEKDGCKADEVKESFGFREIEFNPDKGFFLNNKHIKLRGVCMHQDHGRLGVAVPKSVLEYRLKQLKKAGINGYRCAHNNPDPALLDLCDKIGILVIDENRWFNFSETTLKQLKSMCQRDGNHPCVIVWSVGNEEPLQNTPVGYELVRQLKEFVHRIDNKRPVTISLNGGFFDSYAADASDVVGVNYRIFDYENMHKIHKNKCIIATESVASRNNRGVYFENKENQEEVDYAPAYDAKRSGFGSSFSEAIKASEENEFIAGTFIWAGMDYRGEAVYPLGISAAGLFDNCGFTKDSAYIAKANWTNKPMIHVMPSWNLLGHENESIPVCVYTNTSKVELFLNGKSLGIKEANKFEPVKYDVIYEPGTIKAIGYIDDNAVAEDEKTTASNPKKINLVQENQVTNNGEDAAVINISLVDEDENELTDANCLLECVVLEGGSLLSLDSGDPKDKSSSLCHKRNMFNGKLQAIVKISEGVKKTVVKVISDKLNLESTIIIEPNEGQKELRLPLCIGYLELKEFRKWPITTNNLAYLSDYNFNDMNTSESIELKNYESQIENGYEIFTGVTVIPEISKDKNIFIKVKNLKGSGIIRVFHDKDCWPNPTPEEFMDIKESFDLKDKEDKEIKLTGFSGNEKTCIIIQYDLKQQFCLDKITYDVK